MDRLNVALREGKLCATDAQATTTEQGRQALGLSAGFVDTLCGVSLCGNDAVIEQIRIALRITRNMCAGEPRNQAAVWPALAEKLIALVSMDSKPTSLRVLALQVLTNSCVAHQENQKRAWECLDAQLWSHWLSDVDDIAVASAALLNTCCATPEGVTQLLEVVNRTESQAGVLQALLSLASREHLPDGSLVWVVGSLKRLLGAGHISTLCSAFACPVAARTRLYVFAAVMLESGQLEASEVVNSEEAAEALVQYMKGAQHGDLLVSQLQFMAELVSSLTPCRMWLTKHGLVTVLLSLLHFLPPPAPHSASAPDSVSASLRQEVLRVLANVLYDNKGAKDALGREGLMLLLSQAVLDPSAPHAKEWALFAIRNAVTDHEVNTQVIAGLRQERVLPSAELADAGLTAVVRDGKLRLEPLNKQ